MRFSAGIARLRAEDCALLEVGPGNILSVLARQHKAENPDQLVVQSLPPRASQQSEEESVLHTLGQLWLHGAEADWSKIYLNESRRRVSLPAYPFDRKRFWCEPQNNDTVADKTEETLEMAMSEADESKSSPTAVQSMDSMPIQIGGKYDRRARILEKLESIFEDLSGIDFGTGKAAATFLELGLDSLFLTQVSQALQSKFGIKITFRQLLDQLPTLDALASYLDENLAPDVSPAVSPNGKAHAEIPAAAEIARSLVAQQTDVRAQAASSDPDLESLFKSQLQTLSDLMTKQLEALSAAKAPVRSAPSRTAAPTSVPNTAHAVNGTNGNGAVTRQGPTSRKFIPFGPVDAARGRGLSAAQSQHLSAMIERYNRRTAGSKQFTAQYRRHLADPRVAAGFRLEWKEIVYPIVAVRSSGSKIWDVDGNEYIDLVNGYGPIMFGHAPEFVTRAIREQLEHGYETGPQSPLAGKVADLICEFTGMDRVTFCNTGSEAVTAALRVARTITARDKIVLFTGAYHGMFDEVVVKGVKGPNGLRSLPVAPGIPREKVENVTVLDYGTPEALAYIEAHANELAAVLVEPVQSRHPALRPIEFLKQVRRITEQSGTALIFDEVVTGFRVHPGGCQALFGIKADLATYGKVLGGGMPIGVLAGSAAFMDALDGGMWNYGDQSYPETGVTFFAGTFVRHPLAMAATWAVLNHLKNAGPDLWTQLENKTIRMADALNAFLQERQVPAHVDTFGSIAALTFPAELTHAGLLYYYLRERGLHVQEGFPLFLTTAHSDEDIARVVEAFKESILEMQAAEFLPGAVSMESGHEVFALRMNGNGASANGHSADMRPEVPLTESQKEIWLSAKLSQEASCCYNESLTLKLNGNLEVAALFAAIDAVIARHEALRTTFDADGEHQQFAPELRLQIPIEDLSTVDDRSREKRLAQIVADDARTPFDLEKGPLVRARLIVVNPAEHHLILTTHHIVCDGWSTNLLLEDLSKLYNARVSGKACDLAKAMPFSAYARSQGAHSTSVERVANQDYWTGLFKSLPPPLELPLDRPRSALRTYSGATFRATIPGDLSHKLKAFGASRKCTLFVILLGALKVLLSRLSGQDDIVVAIPAAGQSSASANQMLVGHCVNFLPLRTSVPDEASMAAYLGAVRLAVLDAYDHQEYTYGSLVRRLPIVRDPSRLPLTDIQFNLERVGTEMKFQGLDVRIDPNPKSFVNQDLFLNVIESAEGLVLDCDYNTALFDAGTIERWLGHFSTLLQSIVDDAEQSPARLAILSDAEKHRLLAEWNDTTVDYPRTKLVHQLFEAQAARTPEAIAAIFEDERLTYSELNAKANQLANYLRKNGVAPGSLVAICVDRSMHILIALLGVLKAGCAYVPLDVVYPEERIRFILEETQPTVLLTEQSLSGRVSAWSGRRLLLDTEWRYVAAESPEARPAGVVAEDRAYLIYTSGSTGTPKGVEVSHRSYVNLLTAMAERPGFNADDRLLAVTTLSFDIAGLELMLPLSVGGRVIIGSRETAADGAALLDEIRRTGTTVVQATPITWKLLLEAGWQGDPRLKMLCGGEALPGDLARRLIETKGELWNMYGPTETTIWSATALLSDGNREVTIGGPIRNTQFYILDKLGQLAPVGVPGELYIGGDGVARGYFKRPELVAQKFLRNPFIDSADARLFKTGDLVRYLPDGRIEFFGRLDNQIKLRGYRIELGEIEALLSDRPAVKEAAVALATDDSGAQQLVAYLVPGQDYSIDIPEVKEHLRTWLPQYMVPSTFVILEALPRTQNGKLDRKALPHPKFSVAASESEYSKPRSIEETMLAEIWAEVLGLPRVGVHDDIFSLGADSVHIFKIASRAAKAGLVVEPLQIFEYRTVSALAGLITSSSYTKRAERSHISVVRPIGGRL